jgi:hypothetical protein
MGLTTHFFNQFQLNSRKVRTTTIGQHHSGKIEGNKPHSIQELMATAANNYDTHDTYIYGMTRLHRRHNPKTIKEQVQPTIKTQHGSGNYRVLGLHRRHDSVRRYFPLEFQNA